jgi:hypothetical protein
VARRIALIVALAGCGEQRGGDVTKASDARKVSEDTARAAPPPVHTNTDSTPAHPADARDVESDSKATDLRQSGDLSTPESAMETLLDAIRTKNHALFLSCFSQRREFTLATTGDKTVGRARFSLKQLTAGLAPGGDFLGFVFGDDGADDSLANLAWDDDKPLAWVKIANNRFAPVSHVPARGETPLIAVDWIREGKQYVVREIATPF